jgi:hypothetical protein
LRGQDSCATIPLFFTWWGRTNEQLELSIEVTQEVTSRLGSIDGWAADAVCPLEIIESYIKCLIYFKILFSQLSLG